MTAPRPRPPSLRHLRGWVGLQRLLWIAAVAVAVPALVGVATVAGQGAARQEVQQLADWQGRGEPPLQPRTGAGQIALALHWTGQGDERRALEIYRDVESSPDDALRDLARYNTANIYLRQAVRLVDKGQAESAIPLIELAKKLYREGLIDHPDDFGRRYNLERAVRLLPEPDPDATQQLALPPDAERSVTTLEGTSLGLP